GTFQRHDQQVGRHFAQQNLNAAVVNIHQVVKHEHKILNLNAQVFVHFFNLVKQVSGNVAVDKVNDVSRRFNATNTGGLGAVYARKLTIKNIVQFLQSRRLYGFQCRHPHNDIEAHFFIKVGQNFGGLVGVEVGHHNGLNLRVFVADQVGHLAGFHPLQGIQTGGVAAQQNTVDQGTGFVVTQRLGKHITDVSIGTQAHTGLAADRFQKFRHHAFHLRLVNVGKRRHGRTDPLYFFRAHVFQNLGGVFFAQAHQQNGSTIQAG